MKQNLRSFIYAIPFLLLHIFLSGMGAYAQSISGIVNSYTKVTYVSPPGASPAIVCVTGVIAGVNDKVMLIQMKGASIDTSNSANFGYINSLNSAGLYEFAIVKSVAGDTITLDEPVCNSYSVQGNVQMIKVAAYSNPVTVTGVLTCQPWNGTIGGVLVVDAADSLTLNADIDVSFNGFQGGNVFGVVFNCNSSDFVTPNNGTSSLDGMKGEGIAQYILGKEGGRAPLANGGGGAGAGNAAAGAGGNYGAGGGGGAQYSGCGSQASNSNYHGIGGYSLPYTTARRLFMGGGGGGPQHDNGYLVYNGGNGGGIILIRAKYINGNNHVIRSDGDSILQTHDEGTSAPGAGGTIYLECPSYYTNILLEAVGGKGGSVLNTQFLTDCHPPSGGGGGGVVWLSTSSLPPVATVNVAGGIPGLVLLSSSPCYNTSDYATSGDPGATFYNLPNPFVYPQNGLHDTVTCSAFSLTIGVDTGYQSYLWSNGATTDSITVTQHGVYALQATTNLGCVILDTAIIKQDTLGLPKDTIICNNTTLTLSPTPGGNFTSYLWQDNSTNATFLVENSGEYKVSVTTRLGCQLSDSVHVTILTKPLLHDTIVCNNNSPASISLPGGYNSYHWSNGGTDSSITVTHAGTYTVNAITALGCLVKDTAYVADDTVYLGKDTSLCFDSSLLLQPMPSSDIVSYRWQDLSTDSFYIVTKPGTYIVNVRTIHNCSISDTIKIKYFSQIYTHVTGDSAACPGTTVSLSSLESFPGYLWSTGDTTGTIQAAPGTYILRVTDKNNCIAYDTAVVAQYPTPMPYIGPDTAICFDLYDTLTLTPGVFKSYYWQDSSYGPSYIVYRPGTYSVTVTDSDGCKSTVKRDVSNLGCPDPFFVPNAFTPNGDQLNDLFKIKALDTKGLGSFELNVFDRWGALVFHTFDVNAGWDGTYKHMPCEIGSYFWTITFTMLNSKTLKPGIMRMKGDVTLIR